MIIFDCLFSAIELGLEPGRRPRHWLTGLKSWKGAALPSLFSNRTKKSAGASSHLQREAVVIRPPPPQLLNSMQANTATFTRWPTSSRVVWPIRTRRRTQSLTVWPPGCASVSSNYWRWVSPSKPSKTNTWDLSISVELMARSVRQGLSFTLQYSILHQLLLHNEVDLAVGKI